MVLWYQPNISNCKYSWYNKEFSRWYYFVPPNSLLQVILQIVFYILYCPGRGNGLAKRKRWLLRTWRERVRWKRETIVKIYVKVVEFQVLCMQEDTFCNRCFVWLEAKVTFVSIGVMCSNFDVLVTTRARVFCMRCIWFQLACEMSL